MKKIFIALLFLPITINAQVASRLLPSQSTPQPINAPNIVWVDTVAGGQQRIWVADRDSLKLYTYQIKGLKDTIEDWGDQRYPQLTEIYYNPSFVGSIAANKLTGLNEFMIKSALGYKPADSANTITINGNSKTIGSNPSFIMAGIDTNSLSNRINTKLSSSDTSSLSSRINNKQSNSDTGTWDATRYWVQSQTYVNQSGARSSISVTTTGSGAASYNNGTGVLNIPTYTPNSASYNNAPGRILNSAFQISTTRNTRVSYTVQLVTALSLLNLNGAAQAYLEISADGSTNWITLNAAGISRTLSVAITLGINETSLFNIQGEVPAGYYCRIRSATTGTGSTVSFSSGQEVQY